MRQATDDAESPRHGRARVGRFERRRLHCDRAQLDQREPALGEQHSDHQWRDEQREPDRDRLQRQCHRHPNRFDLRIGHHPRRRTADHPGSRCRRQLQQRGVGAGIEIYDEFATALGEAFAQAQDGARLLYGFVNHEILTTYLGSSRGLRLRHVQPTGHYGCTGKDTSLTRSAWAGGATRDFVGVDALALADEVAERLSWAKRRIELPAGRYDTILPPSCVADLIIDAYWSAGARVAHDGESVYSRRGGGTRLGEQLARPGVNLYSDPARHEVSSAPFAIATASDNTESVFDNGLPLARTDWIKDGLLESLVSTRHSAQMIDRAVTPYVDNLILDVDGALAGMADLVADTKRGLLLTCLWYIREVDPQSLLLTGLTRDGVYVIEDGEIVGVANNFRWNESPVDLLNRFTGASQTVPSFSREWGEDYFSRTATPALRVPDFNMSSVSQGV